MSANTQVVALSSAESQPDLSQLVATQRFVAFALVQPPNLNVATIERLLAFLSPAEQRRYERFGEAPKQAEFLVSRALLRRILGSILGIAPATIALATTENGKPMLAAPDSAPLSFNLSHSGGYVVCAITRYGEIGVDVERLGEYKERVARRFFHADEWQWLQTLDPPDRARGFYHLWTVKEACIKALGVGIRFPLRKLLVSDTHSGVSLGLWWQTLPIDPQARAAVALRLAKDSVAPESGMLLHVDPAWLVSGERSLAGIRKEIELL